MKDRRSVVAAHPGERASGVPLCVDLDGTLVRSDLLVESLVKLLRTRPLFVLQLPLWLAGGRARRWHRGYRRGWQ